MPVLHSTQESLIREVLLKLWQRRETTLPALARAAAVSAQDIPAALDLLRQRGCLIEHPPTTVTLVAIGLACWQDVLEALAQDKHLRIARHVKVYQRTSSTNDIAWQFRKSPQANGLVILADEQTAGRGRLGHTWLTKPAQSILFSVLLRDDNPAGIERITLLAGLAAALAAEQAVLTATSQKLDVQIKWPNDILVNGRKLAGILVERRRGFVVIGIGMNVSQARGDFPPEVSRRAISLYQATGTRIDRLCVVAELIQQLDTLCREDSDSDDHWLAEWKSRCTMLGTRVKLRAGNHAVSGRIMDIDPLHGLVLRDETGAVQFISARTATFSDA